MSHQLRVKEELIKAGFSRYALLKSESRQLHTIIHEDEHIMAAVYGRVQTGSAMLIATNLRVIYLDIKPLFKIMDDISYDVVSGITHDQQAGFGHVVLHSRIGDYAIRYANPTCASNFVSYIETARIVLPVASTTARRSSTPLAVVKSKQQAIITNEALDFLRSHELGVLATVSQEHEPHTAAVYYTVDNNGILYILTKTDTKKSRNITKNHNVAFTVYDEQKLQTLQLQATAQIEPDAKIRQYIYETISRERTYNNKVSKPPVTKLKDGSFTVIQLAPTDISFRDYSA